MVILVLAQTSIICGLGAPSCHCQVTEVSKPLFLSSAIKRELSFPSPTSTVNWNDPGASPAHSPASKSSKDSSIPMALRCRCSDVSITIRRLNPNFTCYNLSVMEELSLFPPSSVSCQRRDMDFWQRSRRRAGWHWSFATEQKICSRHWNSMVKTSLDQLPELCFIVLGICYCQQVNLPFSWWLW